jgi:hypothetical protein
MGHFLKMKWLDSRGESAHFSFNKCRIYTHDGASAKDHTLRLKSSLILLSAACPAAYSTSPPVINFTVTNKTKTIIFFASFAL